MTSTIEANKALVHRYMQAVIDGDINVQDVAVRGEQSGQIVPAGGGRQIVYIKFGVHDSHFSKRSKELNCL